MKTKFYFESKDDEICFSKEYFDEKMIERNITSMEVFEAIQDRIEGVFWCKIHEFFLDRGVKGMCGKECEHYKPINGKNGKCKYHSLKMFYAGEKITLKL